MHEVTSDTHTPHPLERTRRTINLSLAIGVLGIGLAIGGWLIVHEPEVPRTRTAASVARVLVQRVTPHLEATPVIGFGTVRPKQQVTIRPQVTGALIFAHQNLAQGMIISKGELLFEVDSTPHLARAAQAKAEIRRLEGVLKRHDAELLSLAKRIATVERIVAINRDNYEATRRLFEDDGVGTLLQVAADEQLHLIQKNALLELQGRRSLIPILKEETLALLDASKARLEQADFELANTKIICPFDARVESASAFASQVVTPPFPIATLTNLEAFEISVGIDPREAAWLAPGANPDELDGEQPASQAKAEVVVRSTVAGQQYTWRGYVTRFERVDEATRTIRLIVEVRKSDMQAVVEASSEVLAGERSLAIGMYCRTELPARRLEDALLVPRHAIHEDHWVYVFEPDESAEDPSTGRLGRRRVPRLRSVRDEVLVDYRGRDGGPACELVANELVITSPLSKPIVGMPIRLRDTRRADANTLGPERYAAGPSHAIIETKPSPAHTHRPLIALGQIVVPTGIR